MSRCIAADGRSTMMLRGSRLGARMPSSGKGSLERPKAQGRRAPVQPPRQGPARD